MDISRLNYLFVKTLLVGVVFLGAFPVVSQNLIFKNKSEKMNLPAQECYNVIQDSFGYIWASTENGLCKYNGNSSVIYNKQNGLPDNGIYFLANDKQNGLRLISSSNKIISMDGDNFKTEKYSKNLAKNITKDSQRIYLIQETSEGDIINTFDRTYKVNRQTGAIKDLTDNEIYDKKHHLIVILDGKESYFIRNKKIHPYRENGKLFLNILVVKNKEQKEIKINFDEKNTEIDSRIKLVEIDNTVFINLQNKLIAIDSSMKHIISDLPSKILNLYKDKNNGLWVGMFQKGVYYYPEIKNRNNRIMNLTDFSVSGTLVDHEGGVWCTTLEKGIFYCNNLNVLSYANIPQLNKMTTLLKSIGEDVYVSTAYDNFYKITNGQISSERLGNELNSEYTDIEFFKDKKYISNKYFTTVSYNNQNKRIFNSLKHEFSGYSFTVFNDNLFATNFTDVYLIEKDTAFKIFDIKAQGVRSLVCFDDNVFYAGTNHGLLKINSKTGQHHYIKEITSAVPKILKDKRDYLWIATKGEGLQLIENGLLRRIRFNEKHAIFFDIISDGKETIWASSENGLVSVTLKNNEILTQKFTSANGLLSNNTGRLAINKNRLYISTTEGLCSAPIDKLKNKVPPKIYIHSILVNNKTIADDQKKVFKYNENSITIQFDVLTFKDDQTKVLLYQFGKDDTIWKTESIKNELQFNNLPADNYKLTVFAINSDGVKSLKPIQLDFIIEKPFWKQLWFVGSYVIVIGLIGFLGIQKYVRSLHAKEAEKNRIDKLIAQSQLAALQAQMNPHFIFNAISSIQNYILKSNKEEAFNYLAKFGKLIRMVLLNSRENTLPLSRELETLGLYIKLEQLRFKDIFDFRLKIDENVKIDEVFIPTMLIQPYIENAIWHGLMNLDEQRKGVLQLNLSTENNLLKIVIEDNGIGRVASNDYKKDNLHHSVGMKLTNERLQTIYKIKEFENISVNIIDLKDSNGVGIGTKVELIIPELL